MKNVLKLIQNFFMLLHEAELSKEQEIELFDLIAPAQMEMKSLARLVEWGNKAIEYWKDHNVIYAKSEAREELEQILKEINHD